MAKKKEKLMNLTEMSATKLKAIAYDESIKIQCAQQNIEIINQELSRRQKEKPKEG